VVAFAVQPSRLAAGPSRRTTDLEPTMRCLVLLACAALLVGADAIAPTPEGWERLKGMHIDQLVAYATEGGDNLGGSLMLELREQAIAFARRIDAKSPKLKNLFARKRTMTKPEQEADRALRQQVAERDQARRNDEAGGGGAALPPPGDDPAARLEHLRYVILRDHVALAQQLSLDPDEPPNVVLRKQILTLAKGALPQPAWAWEKRLKERIEQLLAAKYEPWHGAWLCEGEWGELTLTQNGQAVKGTWKDGTLTGEVKGRSLVGTWIGQGTQRGGFSFTLGANDLGFEARVTDKVDRPTSWNAVRKGSEPPPTVIEVEEPQPEPEPAPRP
jgi:hypothetical protein